MTVSLCLTTPPSPVPAPDLASLEVQAAVVRRQRPGSAATHLCRSHVDPRLVKAWAPESTGVAEFG